MGLTAVRNFARSGPVAAIAAAGMARAAYEMALEFARGNTAGAIKPIIAFQNVGYVLGDVAAKIQRIDPMTRRNRRVIGHLRPPAIGLLCRINPKYPEFAYLDL